MVSGAGVEWQFRQFRRVLAETLASLSGWVLIPSPLISMLTERSKPIDLKKMQLYTVEYK